MRICFKHVSGYVYVCGFTLSLKDILRENIMDQVNG
jgi:hypothetical protein